MPFPKPELPAVAGLIALSAFAGAGGALLACFHGLTSQPAGGGLAGASGGATYGPALATVLLGSGAVAVFQSVPHSHPPDTRRRVKSALVGAGASLAAAALSLVGGATALL